MGYNLVKVLIFKRVICGKRHQRVAKKENFVDGGLAGENCLIKLEIVRIFNYSFNLYQDLVEILWSQFSPHEFAF